MEFFEVKQHAIASLVRRVSGARGAIFFELRAILVRIGKDEDSSVRLVDLTKGFEVIGDWRITDTADIPALIRELKQKDPYLSGFVFREDDEVRHWILVDDATLRPQRLFAREWIQSYDHMHL